MGTHLYSLKSNLQKLKQKTLKNASRYRPSPPKSRLRESQAQEEATRAEPKQFLHGRQMPKLLQDPNHLQPRSVRRRLPRMQQHHVPAYWRQSSIDLRLQLPKEAKQVNSVCKNCAYLEMIRLKVDHEIVQIKNFSSKFKFVRFLN